jgi:hypothetical protein
MEEDDMTIVARKPFVEAVLAAAHCLQHDPLRHTPGRMRLTSRPEGIEIRTGTRNGAVEIVWRMPCVPDGPGDVEMEAADVIRFAKLLRPLKGATVELSVTDSRVEVTADSRRLALPVRAAEPIAAPPASGVTHVPLRNFQTLVERIADAVPICSMDPSRPVTSAAHLHIAEGAESAEVVLVAATDGHRLFADGDLEDGESLPLVLDLAAESWKPVTKALSANLRSAWLVQFPTPAGEEGPPPRRRARLEFVGEDRVVALELREPLIALPRWSAVVPTERGAPAFEVVLERAALLAAAKLHLADRLSTSKCMLRPDPMRGVLRVLSGAETVLQQDLPARVLASPRSALHLNARYLVAALDRVRTDLVRIRQMDSPIGPVRFHDHGLRPAFQTVRTQVVMPVRGVDPVEHEVELRAG